MAIGLIEAFLSIEDPRVERNKRHQLIDIIVLTISAVISDAEGWESIEDFGYNQLDWLRKWIALENGVPSHDCIARVISRLPVSSMTECFMRWVNSVAQLTDGEVVAIDGKTARHSYDTKNNRGAIHMVSAWANQAGISLGQVKTDDKSNEITAIPNLLDLLEIKGCIVTIDAMGCQTEIAAKIVEKQADYVLAVKGNQKLTHEAIIDYFETAKADNNNTLNCDEQVDCGHGRIEVRRCYLSRCLDTLPDSKRWVNLKSIAMVETERTIGDKTSQRYYITSLTSVACFAQTVRAHWGVENSLHWVLDVTFGEDDCRIRKGYSAENFNIIRQLSLNLIKKHPAKKSIKRKRMLAALDNKFRESLLFST